jgi:hypothetical protein
MLATLWGIDWIGRLVVNSGIWNGRGEFPLASIDDTGKSITVHVKSRSARPHRERFRRSSVRSASSCVAFTRVHCRRVFQRAIVVVAGDPRRSKCMATDFGAESRCRCLGVGSCASRCQSALKIDPGLEEAPRGGQGRTRVLTGGLGFRRTKIHDQGSIPQHQIQAPDRPGISCRRNASRFGKTLRYLAQSDPRLGRTLSILRL